AERAFASRELSLTPIELAHGTSKFDLTLSMSVTSAGIYGNFEYATELFSRETIERLASQFETLLAGVVAQADSPISAPPLLSPLEAEGFNAQVNPPRTTCDEHRCIHSLFSEQAAKTPDARALTFKDQVLSYAELDRRSNILAGYLQML